VNADMPFILVKIPIGANIQNPMLSAASSYTVLAGLRINTGTGMGNYHQRRLCGSASIGEDAKTGKRCPSKRVDDKVLKETFIRVYNEEFKDKNSEAA